MNKALLLVTASLLTLGIFSCKKKDNTPSNSASVMVVNGCTGTGTIGVNATAGGTAINNASNMAFLKTSGYQNVAAGTGVAIAYTLNGVGALTSGSMDLTTGGHYTVFAGGSLTHPAFLGTSDDITAASGMAKVRFVNLSPDALTESCYIGNTVVDSNLTGNSITGFVQTPAATTDVAFVPPSAPITGQVKLSGVTLVAGKVYTIMLTGTSTGSGAPALAATMIANN